MLPHVGVYGTSGTICRYHRMSACSGSMRVYLHLIQYLGPMDIVRATAMTRLHVPPHTLIYRCCPIWGFGTSGTICRYHRMSACSGSMRVNLHLIQYMEPIDTISATAMTRLHVPPHTSIYRCCPIWGHIVRLVRYIYAATIECQHVVGRCECIYT